MCIRDSLKTLQKTSIHLNIHTRSYIHVANVHDSMYYSVKLRNATLDVKDKTITISTLAHPHDIAVLAETLKNEIHPSVYEIKGESHEQSFFRIKITFWVDKARKITYKPMSWISPKKDLWQFGLRIPNTGNIGVGLDLYPLDSEDGDEQVFLTAIHSKQNGLVLSQIALRCPTCATTYLKLAIPKSQKIISSFVIAVYQILCSNYPQVSICTKFCR
eukprot:TRINITY_DN1959_c0_g2_i2.p1 TRINITY_DN1959_c0_g2~~TRINITY_DN1959_c0_g2_i2.p1  ORF type:complete len:217 (+),score=15.54 TRINITY_DN1959_c0_g2_i2:58-708(+)